MMFVGGRVNSAWVAGVLAGRLISIVPSEYHRTFRRESMQERIADVPIPRA